MKNSRITWLAAASALVLGAALPGIASAQSTWTLISGSGCTQNGANSGNFGNSWGCTGSGNAGTTATAWAYSNQAGSSGAGTLQSVSGTQYANAYMSSQGTSGFGAANRTEGLGAQSPDHAVDNMTTAGSFDSIVLNFNTSVILSQIGVGWTYYSSGADISVYRWTGSGAPDSGTAAVTTGSNKALSTTGWTLVSSLADVVGGTNRNTYGTTGSSWWMISAFNSTLGGSSCYTNNSGGTTAAGVNGKCDNGDDAFKLNFLKTTTPSGGGGVPEPGSIALVAAGLLAATAARKRALSR